MFTIESDIVTMIAATMSWQWYLAACINNSMVKYKHFEGMRLGRDSYLKYKHFEGMRLEDVKQIWNLVAHVFFYEGPNSD